MEHNKTLGPDGFSGYLRVFLGYYQA
jgi:hypothetical protein